MNEVVKHYNRLIDDDNDPVKDPPVLQEYMNKWDGDIFIDKLELSEEKTVLEIGIGTGRIAVKTAPLCKKLVGIDISPKTIERARDNLFSFDNAELICSDFSVYEFSELFDIVYSSLTFMHFKDKSKAFGKICSLLKFGGAAVISLDKNQSEYIEYNSDKIRVYPDNPEYIADLFKEKGLFVSVYETEFAFIVSAVKTEIPVIYQYGEIYNKNPSNIRRACRSIIIDEGKILLSYETNTGKYLTPGGGLEEGETAEECCARETLEETGYIVKIIKPYVVAREYYRDWLFENTYYICRITGEGKRSLTANEISLGTAPRWIDLSEIIEIFSSYECIADEELAAQYQREFTVLTKFFKEKYA